MSDLVTRFQAVMDRVREVVEVVGRTDPPTVVVVSKGRTIAQIEELYLAGHRDFGENRAQELAEKAAALSDDIRWHFVGPLQSNKVRIVRPTAHLLHSLDRPSLATAWAKGPGRPPPALVQVDIGREPQKGGVDPDTVVDTIRSFLAQGLDLRGLMAIPPLGADARPFFGQMRAIRREVMESWPTMDQLSMGMTDDFEVAIAEGATVIRPGRAIFEP